MQSIAFIVNGTLKRRHAFYRQAKAMRALRDFRQVEFFESNYAGHMEALTKEAVRDGFTYIIAVGGDGSLNEVVNGLMQAATANGEPDERLLGATGLGVVPLGTGNDFVKTAGLEGGLSQLNELLENRSTVKIDIGRLEYRDAEQQAAGRWFVNITDVGIGGLVARKISQSGKWLGSNLTYFKSITESFLSYKKTRVRCYNHQFEWEGKLLSLVMAKGKYFGSGLCIAPGAKLDDGEYFVVILGDVSILDYLLNLSKVRAGKLLDHPQVFYHAFPEMTVEGLEGPCEIDMDGEFIGYTPARFSLLARKVNFLMPPASAAQNVQPA